ncbi:MAG: lysylphosphatidylglycerol synthase transmembrane domain-containing protein [Bacteroidota bacterium]
MKPWIKNLIQFLIGLGLASTLLYYTYKDTDLGELTEIIKQADWFWFSMNGVLLLLSYVLRALRWQILIHSSGYKVRTSSTIVAVMLSYLVNTFTPRLGEIARCSALYKTDRVPVATGFGTVFVERVIDLLVLALGVGIIFIFEVDRLLEIWANTQSAASGTEGGGISLTLVFGVLGVLALGGLLGLRWLLNTKHETGIIAKLRNFFQQMIDGAKSVLKLERPWYFLLLTALIWIDLIYMFYVILLALPETAEMGVYMGTLLLFIGGIGWALPTPGGMGSTHLIVRELFKVFGYSALLGNVVGALSNGATTVFTILIGIFALIYFFSIKTVEQPENQASTPVDSLS